MPLHNVCHCKARPSLPSKRTQESTGAHSFESLPRGVQVPAHSITSGAGSGINDQLLAAINTSFNGSPEMTITDTGIDDTLLSYVRCAVAPEAQLLQAGWQTSWTEGGPNRDLPLDTMARLVDPIDFNTEAKVRLYWRWGVFFSLLQCARNRLCTCSQHVREHALQAAPALLLLAAPWTAP